MGYMEVLIGPCILSKQLRTLKRPLAYTRCVMTKVGRVWFSLESPLIGPRIYSDNYLHNIVRSLR